MLTSDWEKRNPAYDFVIVGSGYGGAVAAARLATANLGAKPSICVLERGKEWPAGSFPDTLDRYTAETRSSANPLGLYETLQYRDISVLKGNGLGGTSLINSNVALIPEPDIFQRAGWPRSVSREVLMPYYQRARQMLGVTPHPRARQMVKFQALDQSARAVGANAEPADIAVNFTTDGENEFGVPAKPCIDCGDCTTGCNVGAKNTLAMNYLPLARRNGAEIYTQVEVEWIEKLEGGWRIHGKRVEGALGKSKFTMDAANVILAAGSINTTEILMRSETHGLKVSPRLGSNFSGNGDFYAIAYNGDTPIQSLGFGNHPSSDGAKVPPGPTVVGTARCNAAAQPVDRFLVQDMAFPSMFVTAAQIAFAAMAGRDTDAGDENQERRRILADLSQRAPYSPDGALFHSTVFLVTGRDEARGSMVFEAPWWDPDGRMSVVWDDAGRQPRFRHINNQLSQMAQALGARFIENAFWSTFNLRRLVTFHPLGGCPVGEDYLEGAVDEFGRVFSGDGSVHDGLFVADGALIPAALGANPMLTISALSERITERKIEQLQGNEYPRPPVSVGASGIDPDSMVGVPDAELEKLFRRTETLPIDTMINRGALRIDLAKHRIFNDANWKGFLPKGLPLGEMAARLFTGYYKRFWKDGDKYLGETRYLDGRIPLGHLLEEITITRRTGDLDPGRYVLLHYTDPPFSFLYYDIMKVINEELILYRGYTGQYPKGVRGWTAPLLRGYSFDQMSADDHRQLYGSGRAPTPSEMEGVWRMDAVANANHASGIAYLHFENKPDGRLESRYQLLGLFEGLVMPSFLNNHFQLHDFTPFHDEIRLLDRDLLIGRWVTDLPDGIARLLPAASAGLLHTLDSEDGGRQFGFFYTLTRTTESELPKTQLADQFLDLQLPEGIGMTFDEEMDGWLLDGFVPEGAGHDADQAIAEKAAAKATPEDASACRFQLHLTVDDLNQFIDGVEHLARASGSIEFGQWEKGGPKTFHIDERASRFHCLRINPASGEAEMVYHLEFETPERQRYLFDGRKYMQKDEGGGIRGVREVLDDYTTLFVRLYQLDHGSPVPRASGILKFRTFENAAAVNNLAGFVASFHITGTNDAVLQGQARMRFLAFTSRFIQFEYDPLSPDIGALREDVGAAVARGAETPDFFSSQPTVELQSVLREAPTLPLKSLLNTGEVRIDFEKRRIFRDSFWKGSFAEDNLLGWEERVRTAMPGGGAEQLGALFAGGSFWKRFDRIENGMARGHVVNYEIEWLPGDPEVREIAYPNDSRRYFKKNDHILLLNYLNEPYRLVYDTIKVIDDQNALGVMHLGDFPNGMEFATFVMARNNYPFEKMALEDHHLLFQHQRARKPTAAELAGDWTGYLVFLGRPNVSLLNQANPAALHVSFRQSGATVTGRYRFGPDLGILSPEFPIQGGIEALQQDTRMLDERTLLGRWTAGDLAPGLVVALQDCLETGAGLPAFYWLLTRQQ